MNEFETAPNATNNKGFFQVEIAMLEKILTKDGDHNALMAYIVLCGGVNGKKSDRLSTHSTKSVSDKTGISYRRAEKAIKFLADQGFITDVKGTNQSNTRPLWKINDTKPDVSIAQTFLRGYRDNCPPPLLKLANEVCGSEITTRSQALTDALVLFFKLLDGQELGEFAGVCPSLWHEVLSLEQTSIEISGNNFCLLTADTNKNPELSLSDTDHLILSNDSQEIKIRRLKDALRWLMHSRLVYECITIWSDKPIRNPKAEPLGTLYIKSNWAREIDLSAINQVHKLLWSASPLDFEDLEFDKKSGEPNFVSSGRYTALIPSDICANLCLLSQLRVRNWSPTKDNLCGRFREKNRTTRYIRSIALIG